MALPSVNRRMLVGPRTRLFKCCCERDDPSLVAWAADDLKADRQSGPAESIRQGERWLAGRIEWESEREPLKHLVHAFLQIRRQRPDFDRGASERRRQQSVVRHQLLDDLAT